MSRPSHNHLSPLSWHWLTPFYDLGCSLTGLGIRFKQKILDLIPLKKGQTVVDIGCATGVFLKLAGLRYPDVTFIGVDPDRDALAIAQRRLQRSGVTTKLQQSFAQALPLPDQSVDACFSTLAFHHMPNDIKRKAILEMYRVLKPGGMTVIVDFGESNNRFWRKFLFFEKWEYLEGNLNGLIPRYLTEAGFANPQFIAKHWPGITMIKAQK